jgi:enoyl-CoA hydratase/carnithine racemase
MRRASAVAVAGIGRGGRRSFLTTTMSRSAAAAADAVRFDRPSASAGVATITLDSPRTRNALSLDMLRRLGEVVAEASSDASVRVIVIEANSADTRVFCSGHNLKEIVDHRDDAPALQELFRTCSEVMAAITRSPKAVLCKVDGLATAAGCQLVASCDMVFSTPESRFGTPGINIGLFCSTPAVPIVRCVGQRRALQMLLTGDMVSAETAARWGLVTEVVSADAIDATVSATADKIASKSSAAIAVGKRGFHSQLGDDLDTAYAKASCVMVSSITTEPDAREGMQAFLEKRAPRWGQ